MFCRNCGKEIPENTKFCNHCGASQDGAPAPTPSQPIQPAPAAKKSPFMPIVIGAVVIAAMVLGVFVIAPALSGGKKPAPGNASPVVSGGNNNANSDNSSNNTAATPVPENTTAAETKPSSDGKINKYKAFTLKRADNDYINIELWYRTGSDYVAMVSGAIYIPTGSTEYDGMLADNIAFADKVKTANLPDDIMHFGYDEVKLSNGYVRNDFMFSELDGSNSSSVNMVAEFLGLPAQNGYFNLSDCERYLLESGLELKDQN